ncbi:hypothetical protein OIV83_004792 [Microbotryomycetes sp. JL201]|nr:hypothetical protein OIV83_004792 [Microbotryomycetes sp. JL201]
MSTWTRLVRYNAKSDPSGPAHVGEPVDEQLDVGRAIYYHDEPIKVKRFSGSSILNAGQPTGEVDEVDKVLSPLAEAEVGSIRCIGLNYKKHAAEANMPIPNEPILFVKPSTSITGTGPHHKIIIPKHTIKTDSADFESELGVIIARECKNVTEQEAMDYVLGYTATNDVSSRVAQWSYSKGFDTACPTGPVVVNRTTISDYTKLEMKGTKNDKLMQQSRLDDLIFSVPQLVSFLSQGTTLKPGTLILTGTPHGIGWVQEPRETFKDGDVFTVEISGGIGSLINKVEFEK